MYEKKFNNYSYVGCGECSITGKKKSAQTEIILSLDIKKVE